MKLAISPFFRSGEYRTCVDDVSNRELAGLTVPKLVQVVPSVEYCQDPAPTVAVTAIPLAGVRSWSAYPTAASSPLTNALGEFVSSLVAVSEVVVPEMVGASLTEETKMVAVASEVEKAFVVPVDTMFAYAATALVDAVPEVWSQARYVKLAV